MKKLTLKTMSVYQLVVTIYNNYLSGANDDENYQNDCVFYLM